MTLHQPLVTGTDRLGAYRQEKLQLGEYLVALMHAAQSRHDDERAAQIRELVARLAEDRFQLAVMGQFSRGKSTLMNAILGRPYLPTGARPMTSVITSVVYGSRTRVTVERGGGRPPLEASLDDLASYVAETGAKREEESVRSVVVELPAEILRLGFCFVDSPGVGSAVVANTETTFGFLSQADAVVFVTSFDSPLTEAEISFLRSVADEVRRIFVVLNKRDLVCADAAREVGAFVSERLDAAGVGDAMTFALSARDGLAAKVSGDPAAVAESGLAGFESELVDYLTHRKAREFLLQVGERAQRSIEALAVEARLAVALDHDAAAKGRAEQALEEIAAEAGEKQRETIATLTASATEYLQQLPKVSSEWAREISSNALSSLPDEHHLVGPHGERADLLAEAKRLEEGLRPVVSAWAEGVVGSWLAELERANRPSLLALARTRRDIASGAARQWGAAALYQDPSGDETWPHIMLPQLALVVPPPRRGTARSPERAASLVRGSLMAGLDALVERAVSASAGAVQIWPEMVASWSANELRAATAHARRRLTTLPAPQLEKDLEGLAGAIAAIVSQVESWSPAPTSTVPVTARGAHVPPAEERAGRTKGCVVCDSLVRALFDFMSRYQFELATRVSERAAHVASKGFCAVHTWYYESIASPLGVSSAYAPMGEAVADELESAASDALGLAGLRALLVRLGASGAACPACAHLSAVLQETLQALRSVLGSAAAPRDVPPLCLGHAADLLGDGLDVELARKVVLATANRIRRGSEDMRTYSLKRESLRRGLVDKEEEGAYRDVLVRLAGAPLLAAPAAASAERLLTERNHD
jgi:hypothetical protein